VGVVFLAAAAAVATRVAAPAPNRHMRFSAAHRPLGEARPRAHRQGCGGAAVQRVRGGSRLEAVGHYQPAARSAAQPVVRPVDGFRLWRGSCRMQATLNEDRYPLSAQRIYEIVCRLLQEENFASDLDLHEPLAN
jgi:hypothetical protein